MDDEVTAPRSDIELGTADLEQQSLSPGEQVSRSVPASASDFLQGPKTAAAAAAVGTSLRDIRLSGSVGGAGVPSELPRVLQTLPATVEETTGSRPSNPGSTGAVRAGDSVEYASVTSSVTRRETAPQPPTGGVSESPLLDGSTLRRLQQLHDTAPQLFGQPQEGRPLNPPSTTSSDIQMEVRRQLSEIMSVHEEESRRLRAQVEALVAENYDLRMSGLNDVQGRQSTSRQWLATPSGFPGFGWLGRGLGSIVGGSPPPPPPQPNGFKGNIFADARPCIGKCIQGVGIVAHTTSATTAIVIYRPACARVGPAASAARRAPSWTLP